MAGIELENGIVKLSGFCETTFNCGLYDEEVDGFIVQINGVNYGACVDPNDGYRSYGQFFETDKPCTNTFPPQEVLLEQVENEGGKYLYEEPKEEMLYLKNPATGENILEAGTIWCDRYYPIGRCYFNPVQLPINQKCV